LLCAETEDELGKLYNGKSGDLCTLLPGAWIASWFSTPGRVFAPTSIHTFQEAARIGHLD